MTTGGWISMLLSVSGVTFFFLYSLYLVMTREKVPGHLHSTRDEPPDVEDDQIY